MVQGMNDPLLSYYGHPILPAGYNSWDINGDELNGSGVNEPMSPTWVDLFIPLDVLIITPEMLDVFEGCADYTVPYAANELSVPAEYMILTLPARPSQQVFAAESDTVVIAAINNVIVLPAESNTLVLTEEGIAA